MHDLRTRKQAILKLVSRVYSPKVLELYDLDDVLGHGNFGLVFLVTCKKSGVKCALKSIFKQRVTNQDLLHNEISALRRLSHSNITRLLDVIEDDEFMYILLEYCSGGELLDYLMENGALAEPEAALVFKQIASAVAFAHRGRIVHRDLKPDNVLLVEHGNLSKGIRVSDFGVAHLFKQDHGWTQTADLFKRMESSVETLHDVSTEDEQGDDELPQEEVQCVVQILEDVLATPVQTPARMYAPPPTAPPLVPWSPTPNLLSELIDGNDTPGTLHYLAPEVLLGKPYAYEVDAWSLGVLLYNMLTCEYPFDDEDCGLLAESIIQGNMSSAHLKLSPEAQDLICLLLEPNPDIRMSVGTALCHPWVTEHCGPSPMSPSKAFSAKHRAKPL
jgi:serine/threonine protein kinase